MFSPNTHRLCYVIKSPHANCQAILLRSFELVSGSLRMPIESVHSYHSIDNRRTIRPIFIGHQNSQTLMICDQQGVNQLADMLKAMGHPLRIQIITILVQERIVSMPTLQHQLNDIDPFVIYSNLRYMHKKHLVKKLRKGREIYYGLSEKAISTGFDTFFQDLSNQNTIRIDDKSGPVLKLSSPRGTQVFA